MTARRWFVAWLLLALVCAQAIGLVHRAAHLPGHAAPAAALAEAGQPHATGWTDALFAHDDEFGCRLFDGVGQCGAPLHAPLAALPLLPAAAPLPALRSLAVQRWTAAFLARGPPASR